MRSRKHCCHGITINIKLAECVTVYLVVKHEKGMGHVIFSSVACLALPYFYTLSHKRHDFRKNFNTKRVFLRNISHSKKNTAIYYHKCTYIYFK